MLSAAWVFRSKLVKRRQAWRDGLDEEDDAPERKLQKLDLPEVDMKVLKVDEAKLNVIGDDLAAEDVEEHEIIKKRQCRTRAPPTSK